jgi:hypothetical protein
MAAELFGQVRATFELVGELVDRRIVTSPKAPDWKLHIWKIASKGSTFEVEVPIAEFDRGIVDGAYAIVGKITGEGGRTKLVAQVIKVLPLRAVV